MEDASLNPSGETDNSKERITAKKLALRHGLIVKHALYSKKHDSNGRNWYHILKQFPAARLDDNGYIIFHNDVVYANFVKAGRENGIYENADKNQLSIRNGIASFPEYNLFKELIEFPDDISSVERVFEGAKKQITVNKYERDRCSRDICIKKWGIKCVVYNLISRKNMEILVMDSYMFII